MGKITITKENAIIKIKKLARELVRNNGHDCRYFIRDRKRGEYTAWCEKKHCNKFVEIRIDPSRIESKWDGLICPELGYVFRGTAMVFKCGTPKFISILLKKEITEK